VAIFTVVAMFFSQQANRRHLPRELFGQTSQTASRRAATISGAARGIGFEDENEGEDDLPLPTRKDGGSPFM
jgi:hypothetical protein